LERTQLAMEVESTPVVEQTTDGPSEPIKTELEPQTDNGSVEEEKVPSLPEPSNPSKTATDGPSENDVSIAEALNHIALTHFKKGNLEGALLMFQECLDTKRKIYSGDHASIADTLNNMAIVQNGQENFDEALTLFSESLSMLRRLHTPHHSSVVETLNNIAGVHSNRGNFDEALPLYNECLEVLSGAPEGEKDASTRVETICNIALLFTKQGERMVYIYDMCGCACLYVCSTFIHIVFVDVFRSTVVSEGKVVVQEYKCAGSPSTHCACMLSVPPCFYSCYDTESSHFCIAGKLDEAISKYSECLDINRYVHFDTVI